MLSNTKSKLSSMYYAFMALVVVSSLAVANFASAVTSYNFSSSTEEAGALTTALAGSVMTLFLTAFAVISGIALTLMGIAWIWSRFKKYTGIGKKI